MPEIKGHWISYLFLIDIYLYSAITTYLFTQCFIVLTLSNSIRLLGVISLILSSLFSLIMCMYIMANIHKGRKDNTPLRIMRITSKENKRKRTLESWLYQIGYKTLITKQMQTVDLLPQHLCISYNTKSFQAIYFKLSDAK